MWFLPFVNKILKSLVGRVPTHNYPAEPIPKDPMVRGHIGIEVEKCIFCTICARKCPVDAIKVDRAGKIFEIHRFQCVVCSECVIVCPKQCLYMSPELTAASGSMAWEKYEGIQDA